MPNASKRIININVLPGEPLDGSGRVCIHLFLRDRRGCYIEPHVLHHQIGKDGTAVKQLEAGPVRGRLACNPKRNPAPFTRNGITVVTQRTDEPRAVTCPACKASKEWIALMSVLEQNIALEQSVNQQSATEE